MRKAAGEPREKQNSEFAAFARRMIRGWGRRAEAGDHLVLGDMLAAREQLDTAIADAVYTLTQPTADGGKWGYTWREIGEATGMERQHAFRKWAAHRPA